MKNDNTIPKTSILCRLVYQGYTHSLLLQPAQQAFPCCFGAKTARKMARVSDSFFGSRFISRAAKTENLVPRSFFAPKQHGNACYAGYYCCPIGDKDLSQLFGPSISSQRRNQKAFPRQFVEKVGTRTKQNRNVSFFCSRSNFCAITRWETPGTQAKVFK